MNLICDDLPDYLYIHQKKYHIYSDFRDWMELYDLLMEEKDTMIIYEYIMSLFIDEPPQLDYMLWNSISEFLNGYRFLKKSKRNTYNGKAKPLFSYRIDAPWLIGAFQECYHIDLLTIPYMHWWKFNALFDALNSKCELKQIIYYRSLNLQEIPKEQRSKIKRIQSQIALPNAELEEDEIADAFS